jgi:hypothetical protein
MLMKRRAELGIEECIRIWAHFCCAKTGLSAPIWRCAAKFRSYPLRGWTPAGIPAVPRLWHVTSVAPGEPPGLQWRGLAGEGTGGVDTGKPSIEDERSLKFAI